MLSLSLGTSLPSLFGGQWGIAYTNTVVQPLLSIFANFTLNKILFLGLWAIAGLVTYLVIEYVIMLFRNLRSAEHDIQLTAEGIINHPAMSSFFVAALWRAAVLIVFVPGLAIAMQYPLQKLSTLGPRTVLGHVPGTSAILQLLFLALLFTLLSHAIVVFLRLFAMRMRLFGDDPI